MSVAFDDHGDSVPSRGTTHSDASAGGASVASRTRARRSCNAGVSGDSGSTKYTKRAPRTRTPLAIAPSRWLSRSRRKSDRALRPSRTIMAMGTTAGGSRTLYQRSLVAPCCMHGLQAPQQFLRVDVAAQHHAIVRDDGGCAIDAEVHAQ